MAQEAPNSPHKGRSAIHLSPMEVPKEFGKTTIAILRHTGRPSLDCGGTAILP